jgi:HlyD family secretion protein
MDTLTLPPPLLGTPGLEARKGSGSDGGGGGRRRHHPDAVVLGVPLLLFGAAILAVLAAGLALRAGSTPEAARYRTETVTRGQVTGVLRVPARVIPRAAIRVGAQRVGRVTTVLAAPGDQVKRGQVLARLDDRELRALAIGARAAALAAQVNAKQAEMRLAQIVYLMQNGGAATDEDGDHLSATALHAAALEAEVTLVNAAADLKKQSAAVEAARAVLDGAVLRAPIDGVVLNRAVEAGETVAAGIPLFVIGTDPSEMQVVASVGEGDLTRMRPGHATFVVPAFPHRVFQANVGGIEPTAPAEPKSGSVTGYQVRLLAANREMELRPGMTATVSLPFSSAHEALQVPVEALRDGLDGGGEPRNAIYVLDHARHPHRVPVEVGVTDGHMVEVRAATLEPGASVILDARDRRLD